MSTRKTLVLVAVAFTAGILIGGLWTNHRGERFTRDFASGASTAEVGMAVRTLERLRAGNNTGAVELLEVQLDGALLALGSSVRSTPEEQRDPSHLEMLTLAKNYRAKFPRQTISPDIDQNVARAFALAEVQKGR